MRDLPCGISPDTGDGSIRFHRRKGPACAGPSADRPVNHQGCLGLPDPVSTLHAVAGHHPRAPFVRTEKARDASVRMVSGSSFAPILVSIVVSWVSR